jgi:ketosteroid isomerase-like protein
MGIVDEQAIDLVATVEGCGGGERAARRLVAGSDRYSLRPSDVPCETVVSPLLPSDPEKPMRRFTSSTTAGLLAVVLTACHAAEVHRDREALLQADRDFAAATGRDGVDAWVNAFTDDGVQFGTAGAVIRGHDAIRRHMAPFFANASMRLEWVPTEARTGGGLGYTFGRYRITRRDAADTATVSVVETGTYLSIWRKGPDGWKVEADIGTPDPEG